MPFVNAKCPNCGGSLQVDNSKRAAICPFCKEAYTVEDAINNYVTNYNTNVEHLHADVVNINDEKSVDSRLHAADTFMSLGDYSSAYKVYDEVTKNHPYNYRGWWGLIRVKSSDFQKAALSSAEFAEIKKLYQNALSVCENPAEITKQFAAYQNKVRMSASQRREEMQNQIVEESNKQRHLQQKIDSYNERIEAINVQIAQLNGVTDKEGADLRGIILIVCPIIGLIISLIDGQRVIDKILDALLLVPLGFAAGWLLGLPFKIPEKHNDKQNLKNKENRQNEIRALQTQISQIRAEMQPFLNSMSNSKATVNTLNQSIGSLDGIY